MKRPLKLLCAVLSLVSLSFAASSQLATNNEITNPGGNSATFYKINAVGALSRISTIKTGGTGVQAGFFAIGDVHITHTKTQDCVYMGDTAGPDGLAPGDVAAINASTHKLVGRFRGSPTDSGGADGVGLAGTPEGTFLFASYTASSTIAIYKQLPGCNLKFLGDATNAVGEFGGPIDGMKVTPNGKYLIAASTDSSVGSWIINTDGSLKLFAYQQTLGFADFTAGLDITPNGKYAVIGNFNGNGSPTIYVAEIFADGDLGTMSRFNFPQNHGLDADNVLVSPDGKWLYVDDNVSGQISAAPLDSSTGVIDTAKACTSNPLRGFRGVGVSALLGLAAQTTTGTGSALYASEFAFASGNGIGIVAVKVKGESCSLVETAASPASDPNSGAVTTIAVDALRLF